MTEPTPRWEHFRILGNNCRAQGLDHNQAQRLIDSRREQIEDSNNFWYGYHKGDGKFRPLPSRKQPVPQGSTLTHEENQT